MKSLRERMKKKMKALRLMIAIRKIQFLEILADWYADQAGRNLRKAQKCMEKSRKAKVKAMVLTEASLMRLKQ